MTAAVVLRRGDRGEAVRDLRARLGTESSGAAGVTGRPGEVFDEALESAVRTFQETRGLRVDGICGPETWGALIESGFRLGDRLLYLSAPMLRGDDVAEIQRRLNALGFDAGREDGILGPETETALRQFQRNSGATPDGVCGPATLAAIERVSSLAAGSVASLREREALVHIPRRLDGLRIFLVADPSMGALAHSLTQALGKLGALVNPDLTGGDPTVLTAEANRFGADAFVALTTGGEPGIRCAYFESRGFRSEGGHCLALRLTESLRAIVDEVDDPIGRTYRFLRETRMTAVVCEVAGHDADEARALLTTRLPEMTRAFVEGFRRGMEDPHGGAPGGKGPVF